LKPIDGSGPQFFCNIFFWELNEEVVLNLRPAPGSVDFNMFIFYKYVIPPGLRAFIIKWTLLQYQGTILTGAYRWNRVMRYPRFCLRKRIKIIIRVLPPETDEYHHPCFISINGSISSSGFYLRKRINIIIRILTSERSYIYRTDAHCDYTTPERVVILLQYLFLGIG
jgi:hypothetical protein